MINFGNSFNFNKIKIFIKNFYKTQDLKNFNLFICVGVLAKNYQYLIKISKVYKNIKVIFMNYLYLNTLIKLIYLLVHLEILFMRIHT